MVAVVVAIVFALTGLIGWLSYMHTCRYVLDRSGPAGLRALGEAARGYRHGSPIPSAQARRVTSPPPPLLPNPAPFSLQPAARADYLSRHIPAPK